jgi:YD repeat-containing protein
MGTQTKRIRYQYDSRGNRSALIDHDGGRFTYTYDAVNRITQVQNPQGTAPAIRTATTDGGRSRSWPMAPGPRSRTIRPAI